MKSKGQLIIIILVLAAAGLWSCAYVVDETEQVVITWFGRPAGEPKIAPGLKFKLPWPLHEANYFPKNLLEWDGEADRINTDDKKLLWVDTFARWKIIDVLKFFKLTSMAGQGQDRLVKAREKISEIINAKVRDEISNNPLIETVRKSNRKVVTAAESEKQAALVSGPAEPGGTVEEIQEIRTLGEVKLGRPEIMRRIKETVNVELKDFGIEVVDVKIKRINYTEEVREKAYDRMIAERKQKAEKIRSQGRGEASRIQGKKEKELKKINSEAYKTAQEIMGRADARATAVYAKAHNVDPEFYSFMKSLEVYKASLGKDSSLVLSTDSEFLRYLKESTRDPQRD